MANEAIKFHGPKPPFWDAFINPFRMQLEQPKILLIGVLNWVTILLFTAFLSDMLVKYGPQAKQFSEAVLASDPNMFKPLIPGLVGAFLEALPAILLLIAIAMLISFIISLAFSHIVIQKYRAKSQKAIDYSISEALGAAFGRLWTLIASYFWLWPIIILAVIAAILLALLSALLGPFAVIPIFIIILAGIAGIFIVGIASLVLETIVLAEGRNGRESAKRALYIAWNNKLRGVLFSIVLVIGTMILNWIVNLFNPIPVAGTLISMLLGLSLTAWGAMSQAEIYFALKMK